MSKKEKLVARLLARPKDFTYAEANIANIKTCLNMGYLKYKGYTGSVEFSDEDNCLFGKVQGLHGTLISYEGMSIDEIREDFEGAVDHYLASCKERGIEPAKPYSGKFVVRMASDLHSRVAALADATGTTINEIINRAVRKEVEHGVATT